jgi:excisionase family DNA binding protein
VSVERQALSVAEVAAALGVHPLTVYGAIQRGEIRAARIGRRVVIPKTVLVELLEKGTPAVAAAAR